MVRDTNRYKQQLKPSRQPDTRKMPITPQDGHSFKEIFFKQNQSPDAVHKKTKKMWQRSLGYTIDSPWAMMIHLWDTPSLPLVLYPINLQELSTFHKSCNDALS